MSSKSTSDAFPLRSVDLVLAMLERIRPIQLTTPMLADEQRRLSIAEELGYNRCIQELELWMRSSQGALAEAARSESGDEHADDTDASLGGWGSSDPDGFGVLGDNQ